MVRHGPRPRQWLPVGLALLAAAWCLLLPQARDSAAGLFNSVLAYVQALTGRIHLPLACEETAASGPPSPPA